MVNWKLGDLVDVLVEWGSEPDILRDDLRSGLDILATSLLCIRESPASSTAGSRLLWKRESNTLFQSTGNDGTLSVTGATSNTDSLWIDIVPSRGLKSINDTANTPSPGSQGTGAMSRAVDVIELAPSPGALTLLLSNLVVVVNNGCDTRWDWN